MTDDLDSFRATLRSDLTDAMQRSDRVRMSVIRTLTAAFANAEAVPSDAGVEPVPFGTAEAPRRALDGADAVRILRAEIRERTEALAAYDRHPDGSHAVTLRSEIELLEAYLEALTRGASTPG